MRTVGSFSKSASVQSSGCFSP